MKRPLCLAALPLLIAGCAHRRPASTASAGFARADLAPTLKSECLAYPLSAELLFTAEPTDAQAREMAFKNYYAAMLDVKGQSDYVDCLGRRWRVPWLHAEYRRGRGWLKTSRRHLARARHWITPDQRLTDATEEFADQDASNTVHRIHLAFADGRTQTIEETFPKSAPSMKEDAELRELDARVKEAAQSVDQSK